VDFPHELDRGKDAEIQVAGATIFVARSLWPVPAYHAATAQTEAFCELDAGDQERSRAIPTMVEKQAPLSLAVRRQVAPSSRRPHRERARMLPRVIAGPRWFSRHAIAPSASMCSLSAIQTGDARQHVAEARPV